MIPFYNELETTDTLISTVAGGSPEVQALTLAYAKLHVRALGTVDDLIISTVIDAAASYFEEQTGRQLLTAVREIWLPAFPFVGLSGTAAQIEIPHPPLVSVTSVQYIDESGVLRSFDDGASPAVPYWTYKAPAGPYGRCGLVEPKYGYTWPFARNEAGSVRIRYTCGYGASAAAMPKLVTGILAYLVGNFDQNRDSTAFKSGFGDFPLGVEMLLNGFKYSALPSQVLRKYGGWLGGMPPQGGVFP